MKELERKMFQPDCDNPSGRYPFPKHACVECGDRTAEILWCGDWLCKQCYPKTRAEIVEDIAAERGDQLRDKQVDNE